MPKRLSGNAIQGSDYKNSLKPVQRTDLRLFFMVRGRGLEPLRITPLEPESSASAISPPARELHPAAIPPSCEKELPLFPE